MAEDRKFRFDPDLGQFVNRVSGEAIPHDEPVIIFRARDVHATRVLQFYHDLVTDDHHRQAVLERLNEFANFAVQNSDRMKEPGITHHVELHSSRRHPFLEPDNANLQESRRHERSQDERLSALEHRDDDLERKMEKAMADIDELMGILSGIASDAATLGDDFKNLEAQLQAAQEAAANNQPIDLTQAILTARSAQEALDAVVASAASVGASPTPAPAPAGGDTSGAPSGDTSGSPSSDQSGGDTSGATGDTSGAVSDDSSGAPADGLSEASGDASGAAPGDDTTGASGGDSSSGDAPQV